MLLNSVSRSPLQLRNTTNMWKQESDGKNSAFVDDFIDNLINISIKFWYAKQGSRFCRLRNRNRNTNKKDV